jgi:hypothetical protein
VSSAAASLEDAHDRNIIECIAASASDMPPRPVLAGPVLLLVANEGLVLLPPESTEPGWG